MNKHRMNNSFMGSSKYEYAPEQLNKDVFNTMQLRSLMQQELKSSTTKILVEYKNKFNMYETAIEIYEEFLQNELLYIIKQKEEKIK